MSSIPINDDFANAALGGSQPTSFERWIPVRPVTSAGENFPCGLGHIHGGWSQTAVASTLPPLFVRTIAHPDPDTSGIVTFNARRCFLYRKPTASDDVTVDMTWAAVQFPGFGFPAMGGVQLLTANFVDQSLAFGSAGLIARASGGTLTDSGTTDEHYVDLTCYILEMATTTDFSILFTLSAINAGAVTQLAQEKWVGASNVFAWIAPFGLQFTVRTIDGNARMTCALFNATHGASLGFLVTATFPILNNLFGNLVTAPGVVPIEGGIIDHVGSGKILTGKHHGFYSLSDRTNPIMSASTDVLTQLGRWRALVPSTQTVVADEDWQNVEYRGGFDVTDQFGVIGDTMMSDWWHTTFYDSSGGEVGVFLRETVGQRARVAAVPNGKEFVFTSTRTATDARNQRRKVTMEIGVLWASLNFIRAGIFLRGTTEKQVLIGGTLGVNDVTAFICYATWRPVSPGDNEYVLRVSRVDTSLNDVVSGGVFPGETILAEKDMTISLEFTEGVPFELDFQVRIATSSPQLDGPSVLSVFIDTVQVVLVPVGSEVSVDGSGNITVFGASNIFSGEVQGLYCAFDGGTGTQEPAFFDAWTEGAITLPSVLPQDQASVPVQGEGLLTASENFDVVFPLTWDVEEVNAGLPIRTLFESGHIQTHPRTLVNRRTWRVQGQNSTQDQRDALIDFFDARDGAEQSFLWTPPATTTQVAVKFAQGTLQERLHWVDKYDVGFELIEQLT